jgi:hypothetical protein
MTKPIKLYSNRYNTERYRTERALAIQLRRFILKRSKSKQLGLLIGCDVDFARTFIEYQFTNGMTWDNHGRVWEFDHIVSIRVFDNPSDPDAWHIINIQPLLISDNKNKGFFGVEDILKARLNSEKLVGYKDVIDRLINKHTQSTQNLRKIVDWSSF